MMVCQILRDNFWPTVEVVLKNPWVDELHFQFRIVDTVQR